MRSLKGHVRLETKVTSVPRMRRRFWMPAECGPLLNRATTWRRWIGQTSSICASISPDFDVPRPIEHNLATPTSQSLPNFLRDGAATMLAKVTSCAVVGLDGARVDVEVDVSGGQSGSTIVDLPDRNDLQRVNLRTLTTLAKFLFQHTSVRTVEPQSRQMLHLAYLPPNSFAYFLVHAAKR